MESVSSEYVQKHSSYTVTMSYEVLFPAPESYYQTTWMTISEGTYSL